MKIHALAAHRVTGAVAVAAGLILCGTWVGCKSGLTQPGNSSRVSVTGLRCEYLQEPLGLDEPKPRFNWRLESATRSQRQAGYRLLVSSSSAQLRKDMGDLWDSGRVSTDQSTHIIYQGKTLTSRQQCHWKVMVWDKDGRPSSWSKPAFWTMGLLAPEDWTARYISYRDTTPVAKDPNKLFLPPARQYRKQFTAAKPVRRATIYATALGIYELHLNGSRVGEALFMPGWSDYRQSAYYQTYDVTQSIRPGSNALGAWVADGWYSGYLGFGLLTGIGTERIGCYTYGKTPALLAQLEIEYVDGSRDVVPTDASWKTTGEGPIREADFLMGESYDARREIAGWAEPGFKDSGWDQAILAEENGPAKATFYEFRNGAAGQSPKVEGRKIDLGFRKPPRLEAFPGVPIRHIQEIKPTAITEPTNGVYIFNMGQNFAGVIRLKVRGEAGRKIHLRYGEMLHPDGRLMTENLRKARAQDFYTLKGGAEEVYVPRFTFHGFQYVEVSGYPGKPGRDAITGIVLHSDTPLTSAFECSDPMVSQLFKNVQWTQRANFIDLPTDCPQRDERFGWTGDAQVYVRAATYNADVGAFYTKWLRQLMESQRPSGTFPGYAPYPFQHGWDFGTAWCDAGVICPWTIYRSYGDTRAIQRCWEPMTRFMQWRKQTSKDLLGVAHGNEWGDWLAVNENTPLEYIDTIYLGYSAQLMAEMAAVIGKKAEAEEYARLFAGVRAAFERKYLKPDGTLKVDTQTAYALALFAGLIPEPLRHSSGQALAAKIRANNCRMTTGFLGTRPLLPVLSSVGEHDLAVRLLQSRHFPSWGYEIENGATTIWERWNSYTKDKGFGGEQNASMNSFAHYAFGAVCEWMFFQLAGINAETPGFKRIIIRPSPPSPSSNPEHKPIDWVRAHYDSIQGRIVSNWRLASDRFELELTIPPNTTATVYVPAPKFDALTAPEKITESGRPITAAAGVQFLRTAGEHAVLAVDSGSYRLVSKF